jgi:hypothetical protein
VVGVGAGVVVVVVVGGAADLLHTYMIKEVIELNISIILQLN